MVNEKGLIKDHKGVGRLASLDIMRGLIMILLCAESCLLYQRLKNISSVSALAKIVDQFFHHPWHGLHFWDLVQPAFMFIAGVAMYISYNGKKSKGQHWQQNLGHILIRSLKLFICGLALHCVYAGKPVFELWNVLTQLAFTTILAYLIIDQSNRWQLLCSIALILLTEVLYRTVSPPGFDQPFEPGKNFGAYLDQVLMGKINSDGWVAFNAVPTAAHTIWGVLIGRLLMTEKTKRSKMFIMLLAGAIALLIGFGLDLAGITPIIKRISTSSFVFASAGWVLWMMAGLYWLTDIKQYNRYAWVCTVVGMNSIFIYLFFETVGMQWLNGTVAIFTGDMLHLLVHLPLSIAALISAMVALLLQWGLCYWLFKRKIFFKL